MPTRVRSYSKINLGLAIGAPRADGFHSLATLYQTIALHDFVTVAARRAPATRIALRSNDPRVPLDARNTAWKMVDKVLARLDLTAEVTVHIQKNLPIQGGMGAGSANAAAALIALERELGLALDPDARLDVAAQVGSDVPLFLMGGAVLGTDRGQLVRPVRDLTLDGQAEIACVIALPSVGVSTPQAFRDWDRLLTGESSPDLHNPPKRDTLNELSRTYASIYGTGFLEKQVPAMQSDSGTSGIDLRKKQFGDDLAENSLLALVRTGIENDFETVVFPQYPLLRSIKRHLMGSSATGADAPAVYAALSGSGSALFGLYSSQMDALAAQQRLQQSGVESRVTTTVSRSRYWSEMFAE